VTGLLWPSSPWPIEQKSFNKRQFDMSAEEVAELLGARQWNDGAEPTKERDAQSEGSVMRLSIIIPTLNEVRHLAAAVSRTRLHAVLGPPHEIIVADCGSVDGTADLALRLGTHLVRFDPQLTSRAAALNCGAGAATGDVFLFLDADTLPPQGYDKAIRQALREPNVVGGAFEFALDGPNLSLRLVEIINRVRYRLWPFYYGDQGIFSRAAAFRQVGGYPEQRLFEASEFCKRLGRRGKLVLLRPYMTTSARRFVDNGIYRVLAHDCRLWLLDLLGRPTEQFGADYQEDNRRRGTLDR
jgi:glycosyltransferase involved in cell wall biosynthesis